MITIYPAAQGTKKPAPHFTSFNKIIPILANANKTRDWRIYADFAQSLITTGRNLHINEDLGLDFYNTVYALGVSTINLWLSVFPWATFRQTKGAIKLHALLDLRGNIPTFIHITDGKMHVRNAPVCEKKS